MKVIILAAGRGTRISKDIKGAHKCLLPLPFDNEQKKPLLIYTIETLKKYGIKNISIVTGYLHEHIEEMILPHNVDVYFNPFYEIVNSIGSIWFCNHKITKDEDLLILNADTFLEKPLIKKIIDTSDSQETTSPLLYIDSSRKDSADVKVSYKDNTLDQYGKDIAHTTMAESLDVALIPKNQVKTFKFQLAEMLDNKQFDTWWESALVNYKDKNPIIVDDINGLFWGEIDFLEDYERIYDFCKSKINNSSPTQSSIIQ